MGVPVVNFLKMKLCRQPQKVRGGEEGSTLVESVIHKREERCVVYTVTDT